ncbi:MAG: hypothetical protein ABI461_04080 [Polyangiaceae bacterium]
MRSAHSAVSLAAFSAVLALSSIANANGRFPTAGQLVVSPSTPSHLVLRTTFGILISNDAGTNWDWLCEKAVGYGAAVEDPSIVISGNDSLLVATFEGLAISPDHGCSWTIGTTALTKRLMTDVAIHPDSPSSVIALTSQFDPKSDAGTFTYNNSILGSTDDGTTWTQLGGALDNSFVAETLDAAKSDPQRIYVSGIRGQGTAISGIFLASTNGGQSFTESLIPLLSSDEHAPFIGAVDPVNANRVYVRTSGATSGRLLVTENGGTDFKTIFTGPPLMGFALSPDGSKIFVGASNGLFEASPTDYVFTQKSNIQVQCLATSGARVYACSVESSGFIVGASDDDGTTFAPLLHLATVRGPLACPASTTANLCVPDWPTVAATLGVSDAGVGSDAGATTNPASPKSSNGCGCNLPSGRTTGFGALAALFGAAAALVFRRKSSN